jgi:3-phenylpropionate/trans-cinnamate dioxygenase ferredoxin subunit
MFNYNKIEESKVEYVEIAPADQLPPGERLFIEVEDRSIVIFNIAGRLYAIGDVCSHDSGPLGDGELEGFDVICPRHGARFDVRTGEVLLLPAVEDIPAYPVRVREGLIELGIPRE